MRLIVGVAKHMWRALRRSGPLHVMKKCVQIPFYFAWCRIMGKSGILGTAASEGDGFDERFHIVTKAGFADLVALETVKSPSWRHGIKYDPIDERTFRSMMGAIQADHKDFTFIDLGSGKGKALLMASEYPFRRIIGVEYAEHLCVIARKNIAAYKNEWIKCRRIQVLCTDAATFHVPPEPILFFLFNPFDQHVMRQVVKNIVESLNQHPRRVIIVYCNAHWVNVFSELGFVVSHSQADRLGRHLILEMDDPESR